MIERFKDIIQGVRDRIQNPFNESNRTPFAGAFLIALLLYNWQLVFSLFSFDLDSTRTEKIQIIAEYFNGESWVRRIFMPVLWAFGSIISFYFFNNLSLGVTTFFNRWVKSFVLYCTDQSRIVATEDYDNVNSRATNLKKRMDAIRKKLTESDNARGTAEAQLTEITNQLHQLRQEYQKVMDAPGLKGAFRIVYARYGPEKEGYDVTEVVRSLISTAGKFVVDNNTFDGDPVPFDIKSLFMIYENHNETKILTATEAEIVSYAGGTLDTKYTDVSRRKQMYLKNQERISEIFSGSWILTFTSQGGEQDQEPVIVDSTGCYFAHSKLRFYLRTISIEGGSRIALNKVNLNRKLHTKEILTIASKDFIIGTDSKGYRLEYRRQNLEV